MHATTACHWVDVNQNESAVKIKTQLTQHALYFMNKAFTVTINDLSNFFKWNPYRYCTLLQKIYMVGLVHNVNFDKVSCY